VLDSMQDRPDSVLKYVDTIYENRKCTVPPIRTYTSLGFVPPTSQSRFVRYLHVPDLQESKMMTIKGAPTQEYEDPFVFSFRPPSSKPRNGRKRFRTSVGRTDIFSNVNQQGEWDFRSTRDLLLNLERRDRKWREDNLVAGEFKRYFHATAQQNQLGRRDPFPLLEKDVYVINPAKDRLDEKKAAALSPKKHANPLHPKPMQTHFPRLRPRDQSISLGLQFTSTGND
jgi:hypothetical protein